MQGGYDESRFVGDTSPGGQSMKCPICTGHPFVSNAWPAITYSCMLDIFCDPVVTQECEHYYCRGCIVEQIRIGGTCPMDNGPITQDSIKAPIRFFMNIYSSLQIKCRHQGSGCKVVTNLGDLSKHESTCEFSPTQCPNAGCQEQVQKRYLKLHSATICGWRIETCEHGCESSFPFMEKDNHEGACPKKVVQCPGMWWPYRNTLLVCNL